ncbi:MAG: R3H domain-containing nucleic acid-binding protein, partial [Thermoanaerobaculia bacterium]
PRGGGGRREHSSDRHDYWEPQIPDQGPESEEALLVRDWCEEVIELARFDLTVRTTENDTQILVRMFGRDTRQLVDEHGELLDAIQVLANKALVGRKVTKEIELDANAFKERRIEELEERALEMAARVRIDGREQLLPPMTPIERRIIHVALHDDEEVTTISRGEGFYKRVAILLRSEAEKETAAPPPEP